MPGDEERPDELTSLVSDLAGGDGSTEPDRPRQDETTPADHGQGASAKQPKLLAGRFKTPQELEKAYLGIRKGYDGHAQRIKQYEEFLKNERLQAMAAEDPDLREALGKLGFQIAEETASPAEEEGFDPQNNPIHAMQVEMEAQNLRWERFEFERQLGRSLTPEELKSVHEVIGRVPTLTYLEAWKLTPHYEKAVKGEREKAVADVEKKYAKKGQRPGPVARTLPGQKLDMKKPVTEMSEQERAQFIGDLLERTSS